MTKVATVKQLCEKIWELEAELGLLNFEVQGVKVWQALRMEFYYDIAQSLGLLEIPHTKQSTNKYCVKSLGSLLFSAVCYNPFFGKPKTDVLIFDHSRKVFVDGKYIDIYTHYLIDELKGEGVSFEVYERSYLNRHLSERESCRKHLDFFRLCLKISSFLPGRSFSQEEVNLVRNIEDKLFHKLGVKYDLLDRFHKYVKRFWGEYSLIKKLFEKKRPRAIYIVVSYCLAPIVKAAKDKGIEVIELQHGVFSDYHLGYSFPGTAEASLEYFPNRLLVWDEFWKSMCKLPLPYEKIGVKRFAHFEKKRCEFEHANKIYNQIVVISQGVIGSRLSEVILHNINDLKDYKIIYKLHPGEYDRWRDYPSLVKLESYPNVSIFDNNEKPLYEILAESKYVIGVFSTALFEALGFNCELLLVDLPGIEYMQKLIDRGKAVCVGEKLLIRDVLGAA